MTEETPTSTRGGLVLVLSTFADTDSAERVVRRLVQERLIACGNVIPGLTSLYRWQGEMERAAEVLVLMKAPQERVPRLFERISEIHPYEVPELLALPVDTVSRAYCEWVGQETTEVTE